MNFNPFSFFRTPPPTVPDPSTYQATTVPVAPSSNGQNASIAVSLAQSFANLAGAAGYLQSVILALTKGSAVPFSDPEVQRALGTIYGSVPPAVSPSMYASLVAAEFAALQINRTVNQDSELESNPFTLSAIQTVNSAVETALQGNGSYLSQATLLLRYLQGDQVVYANLQAGLTTYPAYTAARASTSLNAVRVAGTDVSPATHQILSTYASGMTQSYASLYQSLALPSTLDQGVGPVVDTMLTMQTPDMIRLSMLLSLTKASSVNNSFSDLTSGPSAATYPMILSEISGQHFQLDQLNQTAFTPMQSMSNRLGSAVSELQSAVAGTRTVVRGVPPNTRATYGPLAGLATNNSALGGSLGINQSSGLQELSSLVDWAQQQSTKTFSSNTSAFQKLTARNVQESNSRVQLLNVSNSLQTLTSLTKAFIREEQNGSVVASQNTSSQLETISRILSNTSTGNKTTYTVSNGQVTLTSPNLPAPTPSASQVFKNAGIQTSLSGLTASL